MYSVDDKVFDKCHNQRSQFLIFANSCLQNPKKVKMSCSQLRAVFDSNPDLTCKNTHTKKCVNGYV